MWCVFTIAFYLAVKKNESVSFGEISKTGEEIMMLSNVLNTHACTHTYIHACACALGEACVRHGSRRSLFWKKQGADSQSKEQGQEKVRVG